MRFKLAVVAAAIAVGLTLTGAVSARIVDWDQAQGSNPVLTLGAVDTTTAYAVGVWTYSPATVTVSWVTNSVYPQNDRAGTIFLYPWQFFGRTANAIIYAANRQVGAPWHGWDFTSISVTMSANFGLNPDNSQVSSAFAGWLASHD